MALGQSVAEVRGTGLATAALAALVSIGTPAPVSGANAVLIVSDDQGFADISCHPHPDEVATPNIDRIASEGARFTNGYASCPVCAPTRAGLLTGRYHQRFGFYTAGDSRAGLPTDEITLADVLGASGFATGVFGKWHLGYEPEYRPLRRGFGSFYGFLGHGGHDYFDLSISDEARSIYRDAAPVADSGYLTRRITREAVRFIERNRDGPFFAYVPYNAVHNPLQAPADTVGRYRNPDPNRNTYLAMLQILDEGVGEILDTLDRLGLAEDTLVLFFSDNGGARGTTANNGALRGFKHSVYEGGIRVPFLARFPPRIAPGTVSDEPVISIDAFATILAAAGVAAPKGLALDSRDILRALGPEPLAEPLHGALFWNWIGKGSANGWAVRKGRWKLLADRGDPELYDLDSDISEERDLSAAKPGVVSDLLETYRAWEAEIAPQIRRQRATR